jgi:hypothetical protein
MLTSYCLKFHFTSDCLNFNSNNYGIKLKNFTISVTQSLTKFGSTSSMWYMFLCMHMYLFNKIKNNLKTKNYTMTVKWFFSFKLCKNFPKNIIIARRCFNISAATIAHMVTVNHFGSQWIKVQCRCRTVRAMLSVYQKIRNQNSQTLSSPLCIYSLINGIHKLDCWYSNSVNFKYKG